MVELCLEKNLAVLNIDNLTYASKKKLIKHKNYKFKKIDICNYKKMKNIILKFKPDCIVNFAAETHVDNSIKDPKPFFKSNILGVANLIEIIRKCKKKIKFVQISTDEVFGQLKRKGKSFYEQTKYDPKSPYSASKAAADHIIRSYANTYKINFNITHSSNNYGSGQHSEKFYTSNN